MQMCFSSSRAKNSGSSNGTHISGSGMKELGLSDLSQITGGVVKGNLQVKGINVSKVFLALNSPFDPGTNPIDTPEDSEQTLSGKDPDPSLSKLPASIL
jgi:hypothetical protein